MSNQQVSRRQFLNIAGLGIAAFAGLGITACASSGAPTTGTSASSASSAEVSGSVVAVGSTALQPLVEAASEQFMSENPSVQISVQGGGSGQGITQIYQGAVQIGNSDVFAEEKLDNPDDASKFKDNKVCVVGMAPVINKEAGVDNLSLDELKAIFFGQTTNWKELGGADLNIVVINRASGSGTRSTFEHAVLADTQVSENFKPQEQDSSGTVAKMVAETPGAISYVAFSYFSDRFVAPKIGGVEPTEENVANNAWTIWAYEHMYTAQDPDAATQAFVDYMLSDEVQNNLVESSGYIPISRMKVAKDASGTVSAL